MGVPSASKSPSALSAQALRGLDNDEDQYHVNLLICDHNGEFNDKLKNVNGVCRKVGVEAGHDVGVEGELEKLRERIEEENSAKADIQRSLSRWGLL